jgi:hypothetical protein
MRMIRVTRLEATAENELLDEYGGGIERRIAVGRDYDSELATTEWSLAELDDHSRGRRCRPCGVPAVLAAAG